MVPSLGKSGSALGVSGSALGVSGSALGVSGFVLGVSCSALGLSGSTVGVSGSAIGVSGSAQGVRGSVNHEEFPPSLLTPKYATNHCTTQHHTASSRLTAPHRVVLRHTTPHYATQCAMMNCAR